MNADEGWDYDCPQYVDFSTADSLIADDRSIESYFDYDHETGIPVRYDGEDQSTPASSKRSQVTRSQSSTSLGTPGKGKAKTPGSVTRSRSLRGRKENITPVSDGTKLPQIKKQLNESNKTDPVKETPDSEVPSNKAQASKTGTPVLQDVTGLSESQRITRSKTPHAAGNLKEKKDVDIPKNLCTNIEEWKKKTAKQTSKQTDSHEPATENKTRQAETNSNNKRQHRSVERSETIPKKTKTVEIQGVSPARKTNTALKRSCSMKVRATSTDRQKNHVRGYSGDRAMRARAGSASSDKSDHKPVIKSHGKDTLTIPDTPELLKRKPVKLTNQASVKSTEQLNMEKIAYYRQMLAEKRKQAEESYKLAMNSKGPAPVKQTRELTHPVNICFETDKRLKKHPMETRQDEEVKDFASTLRSERHKSPGPSKVKNHLTKPQPFALTHTKRRKVGDSEEKQEEYEPMAVKVKAFTATPDRFRSRPRDKGPATRGRSRSPGVTIPKTPSFETRSRSRPVTAPSRQELEEKEFEESQKHQFKARPVNTKIMTNPNTGIKKVPSKPVTVPHEFHLSSNQRAHDRDKEEEEKKEFHAQPLNKRILEGPVGVQEAKKLPLTVPESPAFALKHRARIPIEIPKEEEKQVKRPRTVPHYGVPFRPQLRPKVTDPEPFTFEERDKVRAVKKSQKIEQVFDEEKKAREFYANPLPDLNSISLPPKKPKPATTAEPFNLDTDIRGSKKAEEWSHKVEEELRQQKEQMKFKARSTHVLEKEPFVPQKAHKATDDISEFELSTAKRAVQREAFEMLKKSRQDEKNDVVRQEALRREAEEQEEYERQRREAVHKAQPIKQYKPVVLKRSEKPLTEPMTPEFKTDTRLRTRAQHSDSMSRSVNGSR